MINLLGGIVAQDVQKRISLPAKQSKWVGLKDVDHPLGTKKFRREYFDGNHTESQHGIASLELHNVTAVEFIVNFIVNSLGNTLSS